MAEPQPSDIKEGAQTPTAIPSSSEDRKAAAALSNLDGNVDNDTTSKQADTEALGKAMKDMNVNDGPTSGAQKGNVTTQEPSKAAVKVNPADVTLLAQQLDMSKPKATELLKEHEADLVKAISAWIAAA